jgi:multidrug transporter EmrE-like cation transporter
VSGARAPLRRLAPAGLDRPALVYLVLSMVLGVGGQVLMKIGAADLRGVAGGATAPLRLVAAIAGSPRLLAGLALYGSGTVCWLFALSRVELGLIYPYTALNFVLVLLPSALLLHERIGPARLGGVLVIALGVGLHALSARRDGDGRAGGREAP